MAPSDGAYRTFRDFYVAVADELPALLPRNLRGYRLASEGRVFKVWYERRAHHYELWFRDGGLEVAYHLEGDPDRDERALRVLEARLPGIRRSLGGDVRLESFGRGWFHLFELWPEERRSPELASDAAARLSEFVRALQPIVGNTRGARVT